MTGNIAQKCGNNLFLIYRQPTETDSKKATICDSDNPFSLSTKRHVFAFLFESNIVTRQHDSFVTTQINHCKDNKPFNCCHAVRLLFPVVILWYKGRLVCWRVTALSVFLSKLKCIPVISRSKVIFFHISYGKT